MERIYIFLDRFYFILKELFEDSDSVFGSRQMYLFSVTVSSYINIPILLLLRLFLSQDLMTYYKPIFIFFVLCVFFSTIYWTFKKYCNFKSDKYSAIKEVEKMIYIVFFFFPYVLIIFLFYE